MRWEITPELNVFHVLKRLEEAWGRNLVIVLFADGSGHIADPYTEFNHVYLAWDNEERFFELIKTLNDNPNANIPTLRRFFIDPPVEVI